MLFFAEVLTAGLLAGAMYALVALGFVLIFKASGIFNFAQGAMVLFAGLTFVSLLEGRVPLIPEPVMPGGLPLWLALVIVLIVMILLAVAVERVVLRPLVAQSGITLFMATMGLAFFIEGFAQALWGTQPHGLDQFLAEVGLEDLSLDVYGVLVSELDLVAGIVAAALVLATVFYFHRTKMGRAMRAVSDDHEAALSVGIPLSTVWTITWTIAGIVALIAGIMWGARLGVQYSLSLVYLKALPVLIIGGFTSISGAIVGGLIVGATEKLGEIYIPILAETLIDPQVQARGVETFLPYLLATVFLLFRPYGLFGEEIIERV
ncbi:MAG: branched-chain amino acid ABC transporter permease [Candidatus Methylomirabilia bacterium]